MRIVDAQGNAWHKEPFFSVEQSASFVSPQKTP